MAIVRSDQSIVGRTRISGDFVLLVAARDSRLVHCHPHGVHVGGSSLGDAVRFASVVECGGAKLGSDHRWCFDFDSRDLDADRGADPLAASEGNR